MILRTLLSLRVFPPTVIANLIPPPTVIASPERAWQSQGVRKPNEITTSSSTPRDDGRRTALPCDDGRGWRFLVMTAEDGASS